MKLPSIDNMLALIKEVKLLEDKNYSIEMVAKFMNMEIIGEIKLPETPEIEEKPEIRNLETDKEVEKYFDELDNYEMQECCCAA